MAGPVVGVVTGDDAEDEAGGDGTDRDTADCSEHRETDAAVNATAEDKADRTGDGQCGERFVLDVFGNVAGTGRVIWLGVQGQRRVRRLAGRSGRRRNRWRRRRR